MGMTNEQFKAYIQGLKDELSEVEELRKSPSKEMQEFADKKMAKILSRLQEALER